MKTSKKRLAIVISSLEVGGAEKMVLDLIIQLKNKLEISLFVIKRNKNSIYDKKAKKLGVKVFYFNHFIKIFSPLVAIRLKKALKSYQPEIIHSHLKASTYVCFYNLFNKNFQWIHTVHTHAGLDTKWLRRIFFKPLYNKQRIKLIAVSETVKNSILNLYPTADVEVINNGIDLKKFNYLPRSTKNLNLISVGRLEKVKNYDYLLFEVNKLRNEPKLNGLYLIGNGRKRSHLERLINLLELEAKVQLIPVTNRVHEYLNRADIFISTSHYEGMPLAVLEAMASGLIVIASIASKDIVVDNFNGFLIDLEKESLSLKLKEILPNINLYNQIRINAVNTARNYSLDKMANKYLEVYLGAKND